jgi:hypothetical protein
MYIYAIINVVSFSRICLNALAYGLAIKPGLTLPDGQWHVAPNGVIRIIISYLQNYSDHPTIKSHETQGGRVKNFWFDSIKIVHMVIQNTDIMEPKHRNFVFSISKDGSMKYIYIHI